MLYRIAGSCFSGKTSVAKELGLRYGLPVHSVGTVVRELAKEAGMNIEEYSAYLKGHPEIDQEIDTRTLELMRSFPNAIFEGRFPTLISIAKEFKREIASLDILLTVERESIGKRIQSREKIQNSDLLGKRISAALERDANDVVRSFRDFNRSFMDITAYDIVVPTDDKNLLEVVETVILKRNNILSCPRH